MPYSAWSCVTPITSIVISCIPGETELFHNALGNVFALCNLNYSPHSVGLCGDHVDALGMWQRWYVFLNAPLCLSCWQSLCKEQVRVLVQNRSWKSKEKFVCFRFSFFDSQVKPNIKFWLTFRILHLASARMSKHEKRKMDKIKIFVISEKNEFLQTEEKPALWLTLFDSTENQENKREHIWTASSEIGTYRLCEQRRFRRACASAQSRQNLRCSLIQAVSQEEPSDRKPDPWPLWMAGHAQLKFVMTECSKTQIRLTGLKYASSFKCVMCIQHWR